jgi:hypothetical protein
MWLPLVSDSMSRALGCSVNLRVLPTVMPLMYTLSFEFSEVQSPTMMMKLWNIVQMYAARNDAVTTTMKHENGRKLSISIGVKRRLGPPKNLEP